MPCNRSGGWDSLAEANLDEPSKEQQRRGPNPLLERRISHICLPVIDTQIMLVDSIKVCKDPPCTLALKTGRAAALLSLAVKGGRMCAICIQDAS